MSIASGPVLRRFVPVDADITFTDGFCGGGGSSAGMSQAGGRGLWAGNHNPHAILVHRGNHEGIDHETANLNLDFPYRRLPRARFAWWSPDCSWHTRARSQKKRRKYHQVPLIEGGEEEITSADAQASRMTMMAVVAATEVLRNDIVVVENVVEVTEWELFDAWVMMMKALGYQYKSLCVNSAHIWDEDGNPAAPQFRDRWYGIFVRNGIPFPDVEPRPLAWCHQCGENVQSKQAWRNPGGPCIGEYKQAVPWITGYDYRCPACRSVVEPYTRAVQAVLEWDKMGELIGPRLDSFAAESLKKVREGLDRMRPAAPPRTYITRSGEVMVAPAEPGGVIDTTPFIVTLRNNGRVYGVTQSPMMTVTARANHHALVVPPIIGHRPDGVPIVKAGADVGECRYGVTTWRAHFTAQRFPEDYWVPVVERASASRTDVVNVTTAKVLAGMAVSGNVAQHLFERCAAALDRHDKERVN